MGSSGEEDGHGPRPSLSLLIALFLVAVLPRLYHIDSRFMNFADHNTANFSAFARNLLDHGWLAARLGQVTNAWPAEPSEFVYFAHHPPTVALLASLAFFVLGVSEPAARILPLLASAATCPLLYLIARRILGSPWALLAALLFAFSPCAIYYGQMLNPESFVTLSGLLCLYCWCRHAETGRPGWWRGCLALIAVSALTDWPGHYLAPAVAAASVLSPATRPRWLRMTLQAGGASVASAGAVFAHIAYLKGSLADLGAALDFRVRSSESMAFTWGQYLDRVWKDVTIAVTPPIAWLATAGAVVAVAALAWTLVSRRAPAASGRGERAGVAPSLGVALVMFGSLHYVIFSNACYFNPNLSYYLMPWTLLLAAGVPAAAAQVLRRWLPRGAAAGLAALAALPSVALFAGASPSHVHYYFNRFVSPGRALVGQVVNGTLPEEANLLSTGTLSSPQFHFYAWRQVFDGRREPAQFSPSSYEGPIFLLRDRAARLPEATDHLLETSPHGSVFRFGLYDLTPDLAAPELPNLEPAAPRWTFGGMRFGGEIELAHAGFAPAVLTVPRPTLAESFLGVAWTPEMSMDRVVRASFEWTRTGADGSRLVPRCDLLMVKDGEAVMPPQLWPIETRDADLGWLKPGESFRQDIYFFFGEWLPPGEYALRVSVGDGGRLLDPAMPDGERPGSRWATVGTVTYRFED